MISATESTPPQQTFTGGYTCTFCGAFVQYWENHQCVQVQPKPQTTTIAYNYDPRFDDLLKRVEELERKLAEKKAA